MAKPVFIEPDFTKDYGDCCITCLKMWTGQSYKAIVDVAPPNAYKRGMYIKDIVETAHKLRVELVIKRTFDVYKDDGILMLKPHPKKLLGEKEMRPCHTVLLFGGLVVDPLNARVWPDVDLFLQMEQYVTGVLLVEEES